jgi:hypothetical protein
MAGRVSLSWAFIVSQNSLLNATRKMSEWLRVLDWRAYEMDFL